MILFTKFEGQVFGYDESTHSQELAQQRVEIGHIEITVGDALAIVLPPLTLSDLKTAKKAQINGAFEQTMQIVTSGYPQDEIASWGKQEQEARAFVVDAASATPLIGALSATRGVEKADLAGRIIYKADAFAQISGQLIGKRQALEDAIDAAETAEVLEAISW